MFCNLPFFFSQKFYKEMYNLINQGDDCHHSWIMFTFQHFTSLHYELYSHYISIQQKPDLIIESIESFRHSEFFPEHGYSTNKLDNSFHLRKFVELPVCCSLHWRQDINSNFRHSFNKHLPCIT